MLGIDIGSAAIKIAVMRRQRRRWCLQACVVQSLTDRPALGSGVGSETLSAALQAALARLPVRARDASVALTNSDAITRTVEVAAQLSDQEIENRVVIEAEQHLPFSLSDASLDFCRLPGSAGAGAPTQDVLWVACRRERVDERVALLKELGIRPVVVDLDVLALHRVVGAADTNVAQVILDLGAGGFRLHAFVCGRLLYSQAHQFGTSAAHGTESERAPQLVQEIRRAIQLFLISTACEQDIVITLVGGLASLPGLVANISTACGRPVSRAQGFSDRLTGAISTCADWPARAPQLALACALAMRDGS